MSNTTSQSKLYIDFSATPGKGGSLGTTGGAIWLQHVNSCKVTDERSVEIVKAMGVKGGAGFRRKTGGGTIAITETRQDKPQVDWRGMLRDEKIFMMMAQDENQGVREKWFTCTVSKVDRNGDDESMYTDEIEIKFLSSVATLPS